MGLTNMSKLVIALLFLTGCSSGSQPTVDPYTGKAVAPSGEYNLVSRLEYNEAVCFTYLGRISCVPRCK